MSGVFMDGGGHESLSHGGHDHGSHNVQHGHGQGGHSFLAQILGLDQHDHAHLAHHGGEGAQGQAPSQGATWNSALQGLKLENLMAGINITPNFLLILLFSAFTGWLGVVYWIRHNEPFANQVLGSSAAYAPTVGADRKLINDCRDALPIKTSAQSGIVYSPQPGQNFSTPPSGSQVNNNLSSAMASAFGQSAPQQQSQPAMQSYSAYSPQAQASAPTASSPVNQSLSAAMSSAFGASPAPAAAPAPPAPVAASSPMSMGSGMASPYASPMGNGGNMRLFSSRRSMMAAAPGPAPVQAQPQAQYAPAAPVYAPVANPNTWSLANQSAGTYSSDTAQFNSQFGAPAQNVPGSPPLMNAAAYPVSTPDGTRLKVVTDK